MMSKMDTHHIYKLDVNFDIKTMAIHLKQCLLIIPPQITIKSKAIPILNRKLNLHMLQHPNINTPYLFTSLSCPIRLSLLNNFPFELIIQLLFIHYFYFTPLLFTPILIHIDFTTINITAVVFYFFLIKYLYFYFIQFNVPNLFLLQFPHTNYSIYNDLNINTIIINPYLYLLLFLPLFFIIYLIYYYHFQFNIYPNLTSFFFY